MIFETTDIMRRTFLWIVALVLSAQMSWAVNQAYYESLDNKSDAQLRQALTVLLYSKHTKFDKYNWDFPFDYDSEGYVWDIYTRDCQMRSNIGTGSTCCCDGINREHVVCQSTFGQGASENKIPQYSDRHHLFLVDAHTNSFRSNYAYGECHTSANASHGSCKNGSTHIPSEGKSTCEQHSLGWLGSVTTYADLYNSNQKVYEVDDEFKGDIARAILYMVVRYAEKTYCRLPDGARYCTSTEGISTIVDASLTTENDYPVTAWINSQTENEVGQMFSTSLSPNYGLSEYGKAILLKWHRQDPVSQKEKDRNDGVEAVQGNRNPFVDYPCLAEYLWGNKTTQAFSTSSETGTFEPAPVDTVLWMANGAEIKRDTIVQNERPEIPSEPNACSETQVFMGWTGIANYSGNEEPEDLFRTTRPLISEDTTFYAVYANKATAHYPAANTSIVMADYDTISGDFGIFNFEARKNNGSTYPTYNAKGKDARVYAKGSLTISSAAPMTRIVFNLSTQGKARLAPISADTCTIASQSSGDETVVWMGESTYVTFTVGDQATYGSEGSSKAGQLCFSSVDIYTNAYSVVNYSGFSQTCASEPSDVRQVDAVCGIQKQLVEGQLLIRRDGHLYDARGQRVK